MPIGYGELGVNYGSDYQYGGDSATFPAGSSSGTSSTSGILRVARSLAGVSTGAATTHASLTLRQSGLADVRVSLGIQVVKRNQSITVVEGLEISET